MTFGAGNMAYNDATLQQVLWASADQQQPRPLFQAPRMQGSRAQQSARVSRRACHRWDRIKTGDNCASAAG